jgi:hypothetical protein
MTTPAFAPVLRRGLRPLALVACGTLAAAWVGWIRGETPPPLGAVEAATHFAAEALARGQLGVEPPGPVAFFETREMIAEPRLASRRPLAPAALLAPGFTVGVPLLGAWLGMGLLAAAIAWTTRAVASERWAWVAGLGTVSLLSFQHPWAQGFAGGTAAALGGALWLGAALRLRQGLRSTTALAGIAGLVLLVHSQPVEGTLLALATIAFAPRHRTTLAAVGAAGLALGAFGQGFINLRLTGNWRTTPDAAYEATYRSAPRYVWQTLRAPPPIAHRHLERYDEFVAIPETRWPIPVARVWFGRAQDLLRQHAGALGAVLALLALVVVPSRHTRFAWWGVLATGVTALVKFPWQPADAAPALAALAIGAVAGLRWLWLHLPRDPITRRRVAAALVLAHLALLPLSRPAPPAAAVTQAHLWQRELMRELARRDGPHLVFVAYTDEADPRIELVYNRLPFTTQSLLWARDRGEANTALAALHPDRRPWLATVQATGIGLRPWTETGPTNDAPATAPTVP